MYCTKGTEHDAILVRQSCCDFAPRMSWSRYERPARSRRRRKRSPVFSCLLSAGIIGLAIVLGALYALSGRDESPVPTGPDRDRTAAELRDVQRKIEAIATDAKRGVKRDFEVTVADYQLNHWLTEDSAARRALTARRVEDAWVSIHDGAIYATVLRSFGTMTIQVKATLEPRIGPNNTVTAQITDISLGRIGAPRAIADRLADEIGRLITEKVSRPGVRFTSVGVVGNRVFVRGRTE